MEALKEMMCACEKNVLDPTAKEVTPPIHNERLATKHNQGKLELSLIPPLFWKKVHTLVKDISTPALMTQCLSQAAHSTSPQQYHEALSSAWWHLLYRQGSKALAEGLAEAMMFGANKYSRNNWKNGFKYTAMLDAALRHTLRYNAVDDETGLAHWKHATFCLTMLFCMLQDGTGINDLEWADDEVHNSGLGDGEPQVPA